MNSSAVDSQALLAAARRHYRTRRWAEAVEGYRAAADAGAAAADDYLALGVCYEELKNIRQAELAYREALSRDNQLGEAYRRMGRLLERTGRAGQAMFYLKAWGNVTPEARSSAAAAVADLQGPPEFAGATRFRPYVAYGLMAINLVLFVIMLGLSAEPEGIGAVSQQVMFEFGAIYPPLIACGEAWRLLASMFLHFDLIHLLMNGAWLYLYGMETERLFGRPTFLVVYLLSGLFGSVAVVLYGGNALTAGASGAIFGLAGAMLGALLRLRPRAAEAVAGRMRWVYSMILYALIFTFLMGNVSIPGHVGGLAAGLAFGWLLAPRRFATEGNLIHNMDPLNTRDRALTIIVALAALVLFVVAYGARGCPYN